MRWKDAPIVGTTQSSEKKVHRESILKPSSYVARVEDKENNKDDLHRESQQILEHNPAIIRSI